jgi:hypothetical protein
MIGRSLEDEITAFMGTSRNPSALRHLSGKIGDFVYKWYGNRLVITRAPRPSRIPASVKQRAGRGRFAKASRYAEQTRIKNPELWALYEAAANKRRVPTRAIAIGDFLGKPNIGGPVMRPIRGGRGVQIVIVLRDKYPGKTTEVEVTLYDEAGTKVESGMAGMAAFDSSVRPYTIKTAVSSTAPLLVGIKATDRFGKSSSGLWRAMLGGKSATRVDANVRERGKVSTQTA